MPAFNASLFKNDRKETEKQPDFTGPGQISKEDFMAIADAITAGKFNEDNEGRIKLRIAGWKKESAGGKAYISLSLSVDDYNASAKAEPATATKSEDLF